METKGRGIQSIEVGQRLLAALVEAGEPMILRDLAAAADLTAAQAHAYLTSFRRIEMVEQEAGTGRYSLGPLAARLGATRMRTSPPLSAAMELATRVSRRSGFMVYVVVWGARAPTVVGIRAGEEALDINLRQGTPLQVTSTASGRLFGALLPAEVVEARVAAELKRPLAAPPTRDSLEREFALIRRAGFAVTRDAPIPGINALAAPVFGEGGSLACVVTLVGRMERLPLTDEDPALAGFLEAVRTLRATSGGKPAGMKMRPQATPTEEASFFHEPKAPKAPEDRQPAATMAPVRSPSR
jgi:DNA-binding IclR family transcriptional regulator